MTVAVSKRTFNVREYYRMAEAGILTEDDRVELIKGEIIAMSPIGSKHAGCVNRLNTLLSNHLKKNAVVSVQNPIHLDDYSEPQPDLAILKPRNDFYAQSHPQPADVLVVIEVADTTLTYDREVKLPLYAKVEIPEVWIVNLEENIVEVYTEPANEKFQHMQLLTVGEKLISFSVKKLAINLEEIFTKD